MQVFTVAFHVAPLRPSCETIHRTTITTTQRKTYWVHYTLWRRARRAKQVEAQKNPESFTIEEPGILSLNWLNVLTIIKYHINQ